MKRRKSKDGDGAPAPPPTKLESGDVFLRRAFLLGLVLAGGIVALLVRDEAPPPVVIDTSGLDAALTPEVLPAALTVRHDGAERFARTGCADTVRPCKSTADGPRLSVVTTAHMPPGAGATYEALERQVVSVASYIPAALIRDYFIITSGESNANGTAGALREALGGNALAPKIRTLDEFALEPRLRGYAPALAYEYAGDGVLRDNRRRVLERLSRLLVARYVKTRFYLVLDTDAVALRPATRCDFFDAAGRGVASYTPHFASGNASTNDPLRVVGTVAADVRWSGDALGIASVDARTGFYGGHPSLFATQIARAALAYLERRHDAKTWWVAAGPRFSVPGLYWLFAEATGTADALHYRCEGQLFGPSARSDSTPPSAVDLDFLHGQSYALFAVLAGRAAAFEDEDVGGPRLAAAPSKPKVLAAWALAERRSDRSEDDLRRLEGTRTTSLEAFVTHVPTLSDAWPACVTAASRRNLDSPRPHIALAGPNAMDDFLAGPLLKACFGNAIIRAPATERPGEERKHPHAFGLLHLFGLTRFDAIVHVGPGAIFGAKADALFEAPSLAASRAAQRLSSRLLVVRPNLRDSYRPLLERLRERRAGTYIDAFLDAAFDRFGARDLPPAFYLADDADTVLWDFGSALPPQSDLCATHPHAVAFWDAHASMLGALDASTADILRALLRPLAGGAIKRCPDPRATCVFLVLAWDFPSLYEEPDCYDHHPSLQLDRPPVVGGKAL